MCVDMGARIFISMRGMSGQLGYTTPQMVPLYNHILFITDLGPHARIQNARTIPSGRKLSKGERMREKNARGKITINSGHSFFCNSQGHHTLRLD